MGKEEEEERVELRGAGVSHTHTHTHTSPGYRSTCLCEGFFPPSSVHSRGK